MHCRHAERGSAAAAATTSLVGPARTRDAPPSALGGSAAGAAHRDGADRRRERPNCWLTTRAATPPPASRATAGAAVRVVMARHDRDQPWSTTRALLEPHSGWCWRVRSARWLFRALRARLGQCSADARTAPAAAARSHTSNPGVRAGATAASQYRCARRSANEIADASARCTQALSAPAAPERPGPRYARSVRRLRRGGAARDARAGSAWELRASDAHPVLGEIRCRLASNGARAAAVAPRAWLPWRCCSDASHIPRAPTRRAHAGICITARGRRGWLTRGAPDLTHRGRKFELAVGAVQPGLGRCRGARSA